MEFENVKKDLREIQDQIRELKNKEYKLQGQHLELLQEKCRKNIGRCFKKIKKGEVASYCRIIDIDKPIPQMHGQPHFNEYQYPSLWFKYPYNGSKMPFIEKDLFSGAWGKGNNFLDESRGITYEEISKEEFNEKFIEVNSAWIEKIRGN